VKRGKNQAGKDMAKQERIFKISWDNKGLMCPFKAIVCQEGYCKTCQIYLDRQKRGEIVVVCAWCGKGLGTKPGLGQSGVSHGICPECEKKHFPEVKVSARAGKEGKDARL